ncbi:MAG: DUF4126 family protein [Solirubrobacterales bacterium]|nr:DUF4126 family protein [Solirubrobacterales bacterium]
MHLVFDILTGIGVAAAVGIRPFLAAFVVGLLAAADIQIHFNGTTYSFLQRWPFLLALVLLALLATFLERRLGRDRGLRRPEVIVLALAAAALGALLFAGSLARGHFESWPGWIAGVLCAAVGMFATVPLFARVRARLDAEAAGAVPLYAEAAAVLLAALSVIAPPIGLIGLLLLGWLYLAGRRREGQKYAGLRILR